MHWLISFEIREGVSYTYSNTQQRLTNNCVSSVLFIFHAYYSNCGLWIVMWTWCIAHVRKLNGRKKKTTNIDQTLNTPPFNITSVYIRNDQHQNEAIKTNNVRNCPHLNGTSLGKLYNVIVIESRMPCKLKNKKSANQLTAYLCAYEAENCIANVGDLLKRNHKKTENLQNKRRNNLKTDKTIESIGKHPNSYDGILYMMKDRRRREIVFGVFVHPFFHHHYSLYPLSSIIPPFISAHRLYLK